MKLTYEKQTKEPYVGRMTVEELLLLRYCLNESIEKMTSIAIHADQMAKHDPQYKKIAKSARRDKRIREKLLKDMRNV